TSGIASGVDKLFTPSAVARIHQYSSGIPRVINVICDHCLIIGYADQCRRLDRAIVKEAIESLNEGAPPKSGRARIGWPSRFGSHQWAMLGGVLFALTCVLWFAFSESEAAFLLKRL